MFFSSVDTINPHSISWGSILFQRNNNTYRMLISLCQLVLEGMLMTTDKGEYRLASFIDEQRMCRLFEKFILEYYVAECPQVRAAAAQIPWALDDGIGTFLPVMQSDIMLTQGNRVLIFDTKYYSIQCRHSTMSGQFIQPICTKFSHISRIRMRSLERRNMRSQVCSFMRGQKRRFSRIMSIG